MLCLCVSRNYGKFEGIKIDEGSASRNRTSSMEKIAFSWKDLF